MGICIWTTHRSSLLQTSSFQAKSAALNLVLRELVMGARSQLGHFLELCTFFLSVDPEPENIKNFT